MLCGHCQCPLSVEWKTAKIIRTSMANTLGTVLAFNHCPSCGEVLLAIQKAHLILRDKKLRLGKVYKTEVVYPIPAATIPLNYLPESIRQDYVEALRNISNSPQSVAIIVRRMLESILCDAFEIKKYNLKDAIRVFKKRAGIPLYLAEALDAIRFIGNFGAHASKDQNTGKVLKVDREEALWLLELMENLLDFTYVQPQKQKERVHALNQKLIRMGKKPM